MSAIALPGIFATSNLRRVRRDEVRATAFVRPDGLEVCLACWKDWMTGVQDKDLDMKTSSMFKNVTHKLDKDGKPIDEDGNPIEVQSDIYEAQQEVDNRIAMATDAMINSLERMHIWAIYRACSIATAWRFPNADLLKVSAEAKDELAKKLRKNVCTARLF